MTPPPGAGLPIRVVATPMSVPDTFKGLCGARGGVLQRLWRGLRYPGSLEPPAAADGLLIGPLTRQARKPMFRPMAVTTHPLLTIYLVSAAWTTLWVALRGMGLLEGALTALSGALVPAAAGWVAWRFADRRLWWGAMVASVFGLMVAVSAVLPGSK